MSLGICVPCNAGNHDDCVGPIASTGCTCMDHNHGNGETPAQQSLL